MKGTDNNQNVCITDFILLKKMAWQLRTSRDHFEGMEI